MPDKPGGPEGSSISDEEWARFLREAEADPGDGAPKEPSARARLVTARLRQEEEAASAGSRFGRRKSAPSRPEGWRTGPAWQDEERRVRRRRFVRWSALGLTAVAGVVALGLGTYRPDDGTPAAGAPGDLPTLEEPFRGSPAVDYADGAAAIELPEPKAVGDLTKEQVASALRRTKDMLVDGNLDPATLRGEKPETYIGLIEPRQRELHEKIEDSFRSPGEQHDPVMFASRFDPAEVRLVGTVVKARGEMSFSVNEERGVTVRADYTFVYPLVKAEPGADQVERSIVRRVLEVRMLDPDAYRVTPGKVQVLEYRQHFSNTGCFVYDGFLHPRFDDDTSGTEASGPTVDPYDRSDTNMSEGDGECDVLTRT